MKESRLINFVTFLTSAVIITLISATIMSELDSILSVVLLFICDFVAIFTLDAFINKKIYQFIEKEIKRHEYKHVNDFFDYMENDKQFSNNVLKKDIPIYSDNNEKIGTQTVYSAISSKMFTYFNK